jgi:hypothetical protein
LENIKLIGDGKFLFHGGISIWPCDQMGIFDAVAQALMLRLKKNC